MNLADDVDFEEKFTCMDDGDVDAEAGRSLSFYPRSETGYGEIFQEHCRQLRTCENRTQLKF